MLAVASRDAERAAEVLAGLDRNDGVAAVERDAEVTSCPACGAQFPGATSRCPGCDLNFG